MSQVLAQDDEPLLLDLETAAYYSSYEELLRSVQRITFDSSLLTDVRGPLRLPIELCERVAQYFVVLPINMEHVVATGCSSLELDNNGKPLMPLASCLSGDETTWWLSEEGLDARPQYVEFSLTGPGCSFCRLRAVSIKIPPLPQGPLSVRDFLLQAGVDSDWKSISPLFTAANRTGWQRFVIPPADVDCVRILCVTNQLGAFGVAMGDPLVRRNEKVGFYSIKFE